MEVFSVIPFGKIMQENNFCGALFCTLGENQVATGQFFGEIVVLKSKVHMTFL